ncbi:hypothetical protein [Sphingomonas sp.]|uniref:hypothetical protein n=1 Tax=Sphingomonas sp. TaxID=28214 RepID=UPI002DBBAFC9|nr:hypothetical protein [Sphingomonas sp.]HEU4969148.1 hypothetical protein [Sphingomonas sp.]
MIPLVAALLLGIQPTDGMAPEMQQSVNLALGYGVVVDYRLCAAPDLKREADALDNRLQSTLARLKQRFGDDAVRFPPPPIMIGERPSSVCQNRGAAIAAIENYQQAITKLEVFAAGPGQ